MNGQLLSGSQTYTLTTNDFMLAGGDGYTALGKGTELVSPNGATLLATVVIGAVQKQKIIAPATDGRITEVH